MVLFGQWENHNNYVVISLASHLPLSGNPPAMVCFGYIIHTPGVLVTPILPVPSSTSGVHSSSDVLIQASHSYSHTSHLSLP